MTKKEIEKIIKANNVNPDIKWNVIENSKDCIKLKNTYDNGICFTIRKEVEGEGSEAIIGKDELLRNRTYIYLLKEDRNGFWDGDYKEDKEGFSKAIKASLKFFYFYY